jgi:hypothetical protein
MSRREGAIQRLVEVGTVSAYAGDTGRVGRARERSARGRRRLLVGLLASLTLVAVAALTVVHIVAGSSAVHPRSRTVGFSQVQRLPLPLRAQLSAARGSAAGGYRVRTAPADGLTARGGGIASSFSRAGVSLHGARGSASLALVGVSDAGTALPMAEASPRASGNRVDYARGAVGEWYANGPYGLEQGFTVARGRPGALTITLAEGGGRPRLRGGSVALGGGLRYGALVAIDAAGRRLPSRLAVSGGRIMLQVDAAHAIFPVRIDPFVYEETLSYAAQPDLGEAPGGVALSADGDTAVVGASQPAPGAVYVFQRGSNGVWALQQTISPGGKDGYFFGSHVALSEEGRTLLVTAGTSSDIGQIWTYTLKEGVWSPDAETITDPIKTPAYGTDKPGYEFGNAVALDGSGGLALVADEPQDAAIVYQRVGAEWHQLSILSDNSENEYGIAIALSGSGNEALVAAPGAELVYSYSEVADTWKESGQFKYFNFDGQHNVAVAISREGNTAISGEYFPSRARVWIRKGSEWEQQALLTEPSGLGEEEFGSDVSISASGSKALILAFGGEGIAAYEYTRTGSTWSQQGTEITMGFNSPGHSIGYIPEAVLSAEGDTAVLWAKFGTEPQLYSDTPVLTTGAAGELNTTSATLKGIVNPAGETPTSCRFEYGTSLAYGSTKACSPLPEGLEPVSVSGAVTGLSAGKTYHFRLQVTSGAGTFYSSDATFTTVTALATAKTEEPSKPAKATLGSVTATASGGTGAVTVGSYGANVGEPPLPSSTGGYLDVYRSSSASFSQVEIKACEIGNAKALWAYGKEGWEPVSPAATIASGCLVFTATPTSHPSVSELEGFRYKMGEPAGQFGECHAAKDSVYAESACLTPHESKGHADGKGKYEWYPARAGVCFAQKKGEFAEGACAEVDQKKGKAAGKYELANGSFTAAAGRTVLEVGSEKIECSGGTGAGELSSPEKGSETLTLNGCEQKASSCSSTGAAAGTIVSFPLEVIALQGTEAGKFELALAAAQFASFSCGATSYAIEGAAVGPLTGAVNDMSSTTQTSFTSGGSQLIDLSGSTEVAAQLTMSLTTTSRQPLEINTTKQP